VSQVSGGWGMMIAMSTASARDLRDHVQAADDNGVILSAEEEAELEQVIAETDEDERAGRCVPAAEVLASLRRS
jgi:hypothetical protein